MEIRELDGRIKKNQEDFGKKTITISEYREKTRPEAEQR